MKSLLLFAVLLSMSVSALAQLPSSTVPDGLGVNIHFTDEQPGEVAQIAAMGVRIVRMDFSWDAIETAKGQYNFDAYDRLMMSLERHQIRALFILDYGNPLYDDGQAPRSDEAVAAFAKFAAAGARHFRGRKVIWEIYNEPNIAQFWKPQPNVGHYIKLAGATVKAMREADASATIIGPATSGVDMDFLGACHAAGLLKQFDGVSVHPYRQNDPESVVDDYRAARKLLRSPPPGIPGGGRGEGRAGERDGSRDGPPPNPLPEYKEGEPGVILSSECGTSDIWPGLDRQKQAAMLARQWLVNYSQNVPLSIWYDWRDDGEKADEPEHHFGAVEHAINPLAGAGEAPFKPKPAYVAAQTLVGQLRGMRYVRRIWTGFEQDWVLLFANDDGQTALAAWTTSNNERNLVVPAGEATFTVTSMLGETIEGSRKSYEGRVPVALTREPIYLRPQQPAPALRIASSWTAPPPELSARLDTTAGELAWTSTVSNPLSEPIGVLVSDKPIAPNDGVESIHTRVEPGGTATFTLKFPIAKLAVAQTAMAYLSINGVSEPFAQQLPIVCANPIDVSLQPITREHVRLNVRGAVGEPLSGAIELRSAFLPGDGAKTIKLDAPAGTPTFSQVIEMDESRPNPSAIAAFLPGVSIPAAAVRYTDVSLDKNTWHTNVKGDDSVAAEHGVKWINTDELGPKTKAAAIDYRFEAGARYVMLEKNPNSYAGSVDRPATLSMWIKGDGSGNALRCRFTDLNDQTFQVDGPRLDFTGWRYVEFPLDGRRAICWGGNKSGVVNFPIQLQSLLLIDSAAKQKTAGTVMVAAPMILQQP